MFIKLELMLVGNCLGKGESGNSKIRCDVFKYTGQGKLFSYQKEQRRILQKWKSLIGGMFYLFALTPKDE